MMKRTRYSIDDYLIKNVKVFGRKSYVSLDDALKALDYESDAAWEEGYDKGYVDALDAQMSLKEAFDD